MRLAIFIVVYLVLPTVAYMQVPAPAAPRHHSLSLEAQSVSNGGKASLTSDSARSNERMMPLPGGTPMPVQVLSMNDRQQTANHTNLQINIRNLSTSPDTVKLEWYFVVVPVGDTARQIGGPKEFIFDQGSEDVTVQPNASESRVVSSKEVQAVTTRSSAVLHSTDDSTDVSFASGLHAVGHSSQQGLRSKGWFVRLIAENKVLVTRGSSETYEEIAQDDSKIKALMTISR